MYSRKSKKYFKNTSYSSTCNGVDVTRYYPSLVRIHIPPRPENKREASCCELPYYLWIIPSLLAQWVNMYVFLCFCFLDAATATSWCPIVEKAFLMCPLEWQKMRASAPIGWTSPFHSHPFQQCPIFIVPSSAEIFNQQCCWFFSFIWSVLPGSLTFPSLSTFRHLKMITHNTFL